MHAYRDVVKIKFNQMVHVSVGQALLDFRQVFVGNAQLIRLRTQNKLHVFAMSYHQYIIVNKIDVSLVLSTQFLTNVGTNAYVLKDISNKIISAKDIKSVHQIPNLMLHPLVAVNASVSFQVNTSSTIDVNLALKTNNGMANNVYV